MLVCHLFIPPPPPLAASSSSAANFLRSPFNGAAFKDHLALGPLAPILSSWLSSWLRPRETFHIPCNVCLSHLQSFVVCFGSVHLSIPSSSFEVSRWAEQCCVASRVCDFAPAFAESNNNKFLRRSNSPQKSGKGRWRDIIASSPPKESFIRCHRCIFVGTTEL